MTKGQIVIGGTFPLSGVASLYAPIPRGMEAYFKYINARKGKDGKRGVGGRQIVWKYYDDTYNPATAVQLHNKLVLEDKVFAIVGTLGTEDNQAVRPFLNQRKVPHILVSTGASFWGLQYKQFPWTIGWQPDYIAEGRTYGQWIVRNAPNAKIAVFLQNDDYGKDYLRGLKIGLGAKKNLIVSEQTYELSDASYASQLARQKATGADTWVLLTTTDTDGARHRDCQGAQLEAGHDRHQLRCCDRCRHGRRGSECRGRFRQRRRQHQLPQERHRSEVRERRDRQAVPHIAREVRAKQRRREQPVLLLRLRKGGRHRPASVCRGQESDSSLAHARNPEHELGQPVHAQGRQGQDEQERSLPDLTDQADPVHEPELDEFGNLFKGR